MDQLYTLHLEAPAADVLACALLQAIDDLEARAVIAEHHDPIVGPGSAAEYRSDAQRLRLVLDVIAPDSRAPSPDRAAVVWIDGIWTVANGHPVRLQRQDDLEGLLESSLDLVEHELLDPHDALTAIHHLVANGRHPATTPDVIDLSHDDEQTPTATVQGTPKLLTSPFPTPQAAHRLAPGCQLSPAHVPETGAGSC